MSENAFGRAIDTHLSGSIASLANYCYVFYDTVLLADGTSVGSDSGGSDGGEESKTCYNRDSMLACEQGK
ncbi:hypothetical protein KSB_95790 [Ktedonobacter robiniae]|uniref:Uncharacterized protein n=1 Tax=Ktedonobacter robiniae TaxID=2778365 RepID=A0ABQ3V875_9CHLR|nr:hypothetical protein KSB_95790 [Ktedonobacter robiniae]